MFNLFIQNWIGLVIGLGVSVLLCLVLGFTAFKNNIIAGTFISILLVVVFVLAGVFVQDYFFANKDKGRAGEEYQDIYNSDVTRLNLDEILTVDTVGNFTRSYVLEHREDMPKTADSYGNISMVEYSDVVVFYYDKTENDIKYTVNAIFTKSGSGIVFDGCFNVKLELHYNTIFLFAKEYYFKPYMQDFESAANNDNLLSLTDMYFFASVVILYKQ